MPDVQFATRQAAGRREPPSSAARGFAFFDVDDTLIAVKSMFDFFRHLCLEEARDPARLAAFETEFRALRRASVSREILNRRYYAHLRGESEAGLAAMADRWWAALTHTRPAVFYPAATARLMAHAQAGVEPVFVSGSCQAILGPVARALNVRHVLAAPVLIDADGRLTGELGTPQTIGDGKRRAVGRFLRRMKVDAGRCHAYGDDISDCPMLEAAGHATVVGDATELAVLGAGRGWEILRPGDPVPLDRVMLDDTVSVLLKQ